MRVGSIATALGLLAMTAGCSGVRVYEPLDGQNYYDGAFQYATQKHEIDTVVLGTPFGPAASDDIAAITTAHMKGATEGPVVSFKPVAWAGAGDGNNGFRVVVLFDGKSPFIDDDLCKDGPSIETAPGASPVTMHAAFCEGPNLISSASGEVGSLSGPQDPKFRQLVREVAHAMIPAVDKNAISNDSGAVLTN